jgi:hypothetical protein
VGKISKENIDVIREYLLSFNEGVRNNIRSTLSATLLKYITIIENGFIKDESIDKISAEIGFTESIEELLKIRNEYFVSLAQISLDQATNQTLEQIKASNNQSFQKLLNEMSDNDSFEKDMSISLKSLQRDEMKKLFKEIDKEDEFEIADNEIKTAITSVERESMKKRFAEIDKEEHRSKVFKIITRYAVAAAVIGILIGGAYLRFFNHEASDDNSIVANVELPNLIESSEYSKSIIVDNRGSGLAGNISIKDSISIQTNGLTKQIDTLRAMLEKAIPDNTGEHGQTNSRITKQIDSLLNILNTYTYDFKTKKVVLNVPHVSIIKNIIAINPNNLSEFYISIEGKYYLIKNTEAPLKLYPITDKKDIEKLKRIELLN